MGGSMSCPDGEGKSKCIEILGEYEKVQKELVFAKVLKQSALSKRTKEMTEMKEQQAERKKELNNLVKTRTNRVKTKKNLLIATKRSLQSKISEIKQQVAATIREQKRLEQKAKSNARKSRTLAKIEGRVT